MSENKFKTFQVEIKEDNVLRELLQIVKECWPEENSKLIVSDEIKKILKRNDSRK